MEKYQRLLPSGSGCAICKTVFFRSGTEYVTCAGQLRGVHNDGCTICDDFWPNETSLPCKPQSELTHCAAVTGRGYERCDAGFFDDRKVCKV